MPGDRRLQINQLLEIQTASDEQQTKNDARRSCSKVSEIICEHLEIQVPFYTLGMNTKKEPEIVIG